MLNKDTLNTLEKDLNQVQHVLNRKEDKARIEKMYRKKEKKQKIKRLVVTYFLPIVITSTTVALNKDINIFPQTVEIPASRKTTVTSLGEESFITKKEPFNEDETQIKSFHPWEPTKNGLYEQEVITYQCNPTLIERYGVDEILSMEESELQEHFARYDIERITTNQTPKEEKPYYNEVTYLSKDPNLSYQSKEAFFPYLGKIVLFIGTNIALIRSLRRFYRKKEHNKIAHEDQSRYIYLNDRELNQIIEIQKNNIKRLQEDAPQIHPQIKQKKKVVK